jgi:hypothetical protein
MEREGRQSAAGCFNKREMMNGLEKKEERNIRIVYI